MTHLSPDCGGGKHRACSGDAWDDDLDQPTPLHLPMPPGGPVTDLSETTWTLGDDAVLFTLALGITLQPWQIGVLCQVMGPHRTPAPSDKETP